MYLYTEFYTDMSDQLDKYIELDNARHSLHAENQALKKQKDVIDNKIRRNVAAVQVLSEALQALETYVCYNCKGRKKRPSWHDGEGPEICPVCKGSGEADRTVTAVEGNSKK